MRSGLLQYLAVFRRLPWLGAATNMITVVRPTVMPVSTFDSDFQATVSRWIKSDGEVLVVIRFVFGAGSKSFEFFDEMATFRARLVELRPSDFVIVLRGKHLPLRGRVDDDFISRVRTAVADGDDWLIVCLDKITMGKASWYHDYAGNTQAELEEELRDDYCFGKRVAVGLEPPYGMDSDSVVSAFVPNADGSVTVGAY
jgi:hypothetical protein